MNDSLFENLMILRWCSVFQCCILGLIGFWMNDGCHYFVGVIAGSTYWYFKTWSIKWKKKNKKGKNAYLELNFTQLQLQETTKLITTSRGNRKLHNAYNLMSCHFLTQTKRKDTTTKKKKLTKKKYNAKILNGTKLTLQSGKSEALPSFYV